MTDKEQLFSQCGAVRHNFPQTKKSLTKLFYLLECLCRTSLADAARLVHEVLVLELPRVSYRRRRRHRSRRAGGLLSVRRPSVDDVAGGRRRRRLRGGVPVGRRRRRHDDDDVSTVTATAAEATTMVDRGCPRRWRSKKTSTDRRYVFGNSLRTVQMTSGEGTEKDSSSSSSSSSCGSSSSSSSRGTTTSGWRWRHRSHPLLLVDRPSASEHPREGYTHRM